MVGFVNDSTCITGGSTEDSYTDLKSKITQDAQLWHDLLFVSGGKLELPKCGYHLVYYNFDDAGIPHMRVTEPNKSVTLKHNNGTDVQIKAKSIFQSRNNLCHHKSPGGDRSIQASKAEEIALSIVDSMSKCNCTRTEIRMIYNTVFKPSLEYTLGQSFLSKKQLNSIKRKTLPKIKAMCGFNRNTSKAIMEAQIELSGGGFSPLHVTASASSVMHFMQNWRTEEEDLGKLIRITYARAQYNTGVSFSLFKRPDVNLPHLQGTVIESIRSYLSSINAKIHLDNPTIRLPLRTNDIAIMDFAIKLNLASNQLLRRVNAV